MSACSFLIYSLLVLWFLFVCKLRPAYKFHLPLTVNQGTLYPSILGNPSEATFGQKHISYVDITKRPLWQCFPRNIFHHHGYISLHPTKCHHCWLTVPEIYVKLGPDRNITIATIQHRVPHYLKTATQSIIKRKIYRQSKPSPCCHDSKYFPDMYSWRRTRKLRAEGASANYPPRVMKNRILRITRKG